MCGGVATVATLASYTTGPSLVFRSRESLPSKANQPVELDIGFRDRKNLDRKEHM